MKFLRKQAESVVRAAWKKLVNPVVSIGQTAWPKDPADLQRYGIRFDYDGIVEKDGETYHKYQCQPNAGKIPSSLQAWREDNGGTHAVIVTLLIKKNGNEQHVRDVINKAFKEA